MISESFYVISDSIDDVVALHSRNPPVDAPLQVHKLNYCQHPVRRVSLCTASSNNFLSSASDTLLEENGKQAPQSLSSYEIYRHVYRVVVVVVDAAHWDFPSAHAEMRVFTSG